MFQAGAAARLGSKPTGIDRGRRISVVGQARRAVPPADHFLQLASGPVDRPRIIVAMTLEFAPHDLACAPAGELPKIG